MSLPREDLWPTSRLGELLAAFAERLGTAPPGTAVPEPPASNADVARWLEAAASRLGLQAEPVEVRFWQKRGVEILDFALDLYVAELGRHARTFPVSEAAA